MGGHPRGVACRSSNTSPIALESHAKHTNVVKKETIAASHGYRLCCRNPDVGWVVALVPRLDNRHCAPNCSSPETAFPPCSDHQSTCIRYVTQHYLLKLKGADNLSLSRCDEHLVQRRLWLHLPCTRPNARRRDQTRRGVYRQRLHQPAQRPDD